MRSVTHAALGLALALSNLSCNESAIKPRRSRSEAVSGSSREMSGPSLFSNDALKPALRSLLSKVDGRALRLEIHARELVLQAEDVKASGTVLEYHYREGKLGEAEHASLRGKGELKDNLFDLAQVKLTALPELAAEAIRRVDAEEGHVDHVLVRRNLPESDEVRIRVYVASPRQSGHLDADDQGRPL